jgi:tetratricopeptide (TPR) repeat protein
LNWLIGIILVFIFIYSPFKRGLFFDPEMYLIEAVIMSSFVVWAVYSFFSKKVNVSNIYYALFLVPLTYVVSFIHAESPSGNFDNLFRWIAYTCFFIMLLSLGKHEWFGKKLSVIFQLTGIIIVLFSLAGLFGWVEYKDLLMGERLTGPFQYANTFASLMGAFWLYSTFTVLKSFNKPKQLILCSLPLIAYGVSFFHAYSRGALLLFPIAWFIGLILIKAKDQLNYILVTAATMLLTIASFYVLSDNASGKTLGLAILIVAALVLTAIIYLLSTKQVQGWINNISAKGVLSKYGHVIIPVGMLLIAFLLILDIINNGLFYKVLPETLQQRINNLSLHSASALGRTGMFKDAFEISKLQPIFGAGGEGWRVLFPHYQTEPYFSNEVHNGYLEILLNVGWFGFLIFALGMLGLCILAIRRFKAAGTGEKKLEMAAGISAIAMILLHAGIDFDFSFGVIWFALFWLFAILLQGGVEKQPVLNASAQYAWLAGRILITAFVITGAVFAFRFHIAEQQLTAIRGQQIDVNQGIQVYSSAAKFNPYKVEFEMQLAIIYANEFVNSKNPQSKEMAEEYIRKVEALEPNNAVAQYQISQIHIMTGDYDRANEYLARAIEFDPFNLEYYQTTLDLNRQLAAYFESNGDPDRAKSHAETAVRYYEQYVGWYAQFINVQVPDRRPMLMSKEARLAATRSYLMLQRPEQAFEAVKRYNPNLENGVYDEAQGKLLVQSFNILTLEEVLKLNTNRIMILSVKDEATQNLPSSAIGLLEGMGSSIASLNYRGSYSSVIYGGRVVAENISNESEAVLDSANSPDLASVFGDREFKIYSAGQPFGNRSSILIDDVEYSRNGRGINIAVFDNDFNYITTLSFDTNRSDVNIYK